MKEEILDFSDVQKFQERFHIPFTSSITRWTWEVLNGFFSEGEDIIELIISDPILPASYVKNPWMWCNNILRAKVQYPNLVCKHHNNTTILIASNVAQPSTNFTTSLVARLQLKTKITFDLEEMPLAYQLNPYTLAWRLRERKGINTKVSKIGNTIVFTKI